MKNVQLTIYLNEADMRGEVPLHELLVRRLLHSEVAGATVFHGVMGYGKHGKVHRKRLFGVSDDRPISIVAIDTEARIRAVLPELRALLGPGVMTLQEIEVV